MPAVSKKQQRFFGYLLSNPEERKKKGISKKAAKDFAQDVKEAAPQKVMDFKTFMSIAEGEFAPQRKNHPKELSKKLPKGYSYSDPKREGKHSTSKLQVKQKGKKEPIDTDIKVTGSVIGDKAGTSFWKKHTRARNTLKGIDREVKRIRSQKKEKTPAQRMDKAYDRRVKAKGRQVLGDITKLGKSKNPRPKDK